jgi:hypothetical protein
MNGAALIFLVIWAFIILVPCVAMCWLGFRLIEKLGQYPSKTPTIQKNIMVPYIIIAVSAMTALLIFFKVLTVAE